jgi:hypothetical protein
MDDVTTTSHHASASTLESAAAIGQHRGSWGTWGPDRRRLVALTVVNWLAVGAVMAVMFLLDDLRLVIVAAGLLAVDVVLGRRLHDAEEREGAFDTSDAKPVTDDEGQLLERMQLAGSDRDADLFVAGEWLGGNPVLKRYEYPTRELLVLRCVWEAIEVIGVMIVAATAPDPVGLALGAALWVLGGRSGASVMRGVLGQRLYRTAVDDTTRERWLAREHRLSVVAIGLALVVAILRVV